MNKEAMKLRTWIAPKEVQIHTLRQSIDLTRFQLEQMETNISGGWFVKQKEKEVKEAKTDFERKIKEVELEQLVSDIEKGFIGKMQNLKLQELELNLSIEEQSLVDLKKRITMAERNHKIPVEKEVKKQ